MGRRILSSGLTLDVSEMSAAPVAPSNALRIRPKSDGTTLQISYNGGAYVDLGTGGSGTPRLDQVLDPTANKAFAMGNNQLAFQFTGAEAEDNFVIESATDAAGSGVVLLVRTQGTISTKAPLRVDANGAIALTVNTAGQVGVRSTDAGYTFNVAGNSHFITTNVEDAPAVDIQTTSDVADGCFGLFAGNQQVGTLGTDYYGWAFDSDLQFASGTGGDIQAFRSAYVGFPSTSNRRLQNIVAYIDDDVSTDITGHYTAFFATQKLGGTGTYAGAYRGLYVRNPGSTWGAYYGVLVESGMTSGFGLTAPTATLHASGTVKLDLGSDARGDLFYRSSTGILSRLGVGTSGQVLTTIDIGAGVLEPRWATGGGGALRLDEILDPTATSSFTMGVHPLTFDFTPSSSESGFFFYHSILVETDSANSGAGAGDIRGITSAMTFTGTLATPRLRSFIAYYDSTSATDIPAAGSYTGLMVVGQNNSQTYSGSYRGIYLQLPLDTWGSKYGIITESGFLSSFGTTTPAATLHVVNGSSSTSSMIVDTLASPSVFIFAVRENTALRFAVTHDEFVRTSYNGTTPRAQFSSDGGTTGYTFQCDAWSSSTVAAIFRGVTSQSVDLLQIQDGTLTVQCRWNSTGKLLQLADTAIGHFSPSAKLHVIGSTRLDLGSDATGDIFYRSSGGTLARLPVGTNGHVLTLASGLPSWAAASGGGYATIQNEGSALTQRTIWNYIGNVVNAVDNAGSTRTDVTINAVTQTSGSGSELQYRTGTYTLGAVTDSSVSGNQTTLGGSTTWQSDVGITNGIRTYTNDANGPQLTTLKSRGTLASKSGISSGDSLYTINVQGQYDSTGQRQGGELRFQSIGAFSTSSAPTVLRLKTTPVGQNFAIERVVIGGSKTLTDNTRTLIFTAAFGSTDLKGVAGLVHLTVIAKQTTGSNQIQLYRKSVAFVAIHNGSSNSGQGRWGAEYNTDGITSTGGISFTFDCNTTNYPSYASGASSLAFNITANSDLSSFSEFTIHYNIEYNGDLDVTLG